MKTDLHSDGGWLNPGKMRSCGATPYGRIEPWVKKAYQESLTGTTTVVLLPCKTETSWWHDYIQPYAEIRWLRGRIKFDGWNDKVPFAIAIFIFRPRLKESVKEARATWRAQSSC